MAAAVGSAQAADSDLRLTIALDKTLYKVGEAMRLTWTLQNLSSGTIQVVAYHDAGGGPQFDELHLSLSQNGGSAHPIPTTGPRAATQPVWRAIPAGEKLEQQLDLSKFMGLLVPRAGAGSYRLMAEYSTRRGRVGAPAEGAWSGRVLASVIPFELST